MAIIKVDYGTIGGGSKFVTQSETVSGTKNITINGLTQIQTAACQYPDIGIAYGYDDNGNYQFVSDRPSFIKINSITGNVINLTTNSSTSVNFYCTGI